MSDINYIAILVAALIPNIVGALYYGPLLGKPWLESLGLTAEDMKGRNELLIYGSSFLLSAIVAFFLKLTVELAHKNVTASGELVYASFHTFQHGALHGAMLAMTLVVPVIVCLGLFQKSTGKNILINVGFWVLCYALMGGVLDMWN